ncbi:MAG: cytidylyltransferase domain-containing protein [Brevinema sp.]
MNCVAFIPLRGGSKSIPLKNIKPMNGRPLAYYVLDAANACPEIDTIIVSTDSDEIKKTILEYPSSKLRVISRSPEVSTDQASSDSVLMEFAEPNICNTLVLIQATSPLLKAEHLSAGLKKHAEGFDSVVSVVRSHKFLWSEDGVPLNYDPAKRPRRQDWAGVMVENGAFYITTRKAFLKNKCVLSGSRAVSEMPIETYVEIDDPSDWIFAESLIQRQAKP